MAIVKPGHVGDFTGKIGRVVVAKFRDLIVGRSAPSPSTKPPTLKQLNQQMRFGLVTAFFSRMTKVTSTRYVSNGNLGGLNAAVRDNIENVITGVYPNYQLDYTKIMITKGNGDVDGGLNPSLAALPQAQASVTWKMLIKQGQSQGSDPKDLVTFACYNVTKKKSILFFDIAERSELTVTCDFPWSFVGDQLHGYLYFTSIDGKNISDSEYVGSFVITE